ncbi:class IV adenylate cyclase [Candidatus Woesearchaeota archaeon]|nr:class IV adenylate cyclase [Candidatus Woesearchaeota archaeon]
MKEIELKILNINEKEVTKNLIKLGAKKFPEELVIEKHFDFEDDRIKDNKQLFRLRKLGDKVELAFKDKKIKDGKFRVQEEIETNVKNFDTMEKIIEKLGFKCIKHREKKRIHFTLNNVKIEVDKFPNIPPYIEIEGTKKEIEKTVKLLGFNLNKTTSMTATEVLKRYNVDENYQKF